MRDNEEASDPLVALSSPLSRLVMAVVVVLVCAVASLILSAMFRNAGTLSTAAVPAPEAWAFIACGLAFVWRVA